MAAVDHWLDEPLVGRAVELRRLRVWIRGDGRLLTLCGAPGAGKSRLQWEATADARAHARIDLFGLADPTAIRARIEAALPPRPRARGALLVVDNLGAIDESVRAAIRRWLDAGARVLASARCALGLEGEGIEPIDPLLLEDAVELLRLRAAAAGRDPGGVEAPALRAIAAALDRNPLALELAAFQLAHLTPAQLEARLSARFELLERPPAPGPFGRHHRLRDAIATAWSALPPEHARVLARLAVFRGGFEAEAAGAVLDLPPARVEEALRALRGCSLLRLRDGRHFLDVSVRIFAERALDPGGRNAAERRHTAWYLPRATAWAQALEERADAAAAERLESARENLLEIHRRALQRPSRPDAVRDAIHAALALEPLLVIRGDAGALLHVLDAALAAVSPARVDSALRARALQARGRARLLLGRPAGALADLVEAAGLARAAGDAHVEALALLLLARVHREQSRHDDAHACIERAIVLLEGREDEPIFGRALISRALLALERGRNDEARAWYERALALMERCGDRRGWAICCGTIGRLLCDRGHRDEGRARIDEALAVLRALGDGANESALLSYVAGLRLDRGDPGGACADLERAERLAREAGCKRFAGHAAFELGGALLEANELVRAGEKLEEALAILRGLGDAASEARCLLVRAALLARVGAPEPAAAAVERAEQILRAVDPDGAALVEAARGVLAAEAARRLDAGAARIRRREALRRRDTAMAGQAGDSAPGRLLLRLLERALVVPAERRPPVAASA